MDQSEIYILYQNALEREDKLRSEVQQLRAELHHVYGELGILKDVIYREDLGVARFHPECPMDRIPIVRLREATLTLLIDPEYKLEEAWIEHDAKRKLLHSLLDRASLKKETGTQYGRKYVRLSVIVGVKEDAKHDSV
jgi:hypothetical protein